MPTTWSHAQNIGPRGYTCGFCGKDVGPNMGFIPSDGTQNRIYVCSFCGKPTYFDADSRQYPGVAYGSKVEHLPHEIEVLYNDARNCASVSAYTPAVLTCRKLLMHIAVSKGAEEGKSFLQYVEFLSQKGYVPPDGKGWVDHIRERGNEANHEIKIMSADDAESLIQFSEMLLKLVFEFPKKVPIKPTK